MATILITGASTGIGKAAAIHCANLGHQVYAGVRKSKDGEALEAESAKIKPLIIDVTNQDQITKAATIVLNDKPSGPFCLVNNAGIAVSAPLEALPMERLRYQFEVNLFGVMAMTQAFLPIIRETRGRIINMSSVAGRFASPFLGAYASSKFALEGITDSLRRELRRFGVQVVLIEPGPIDTPIWKKGFDMKDETFRKADPKILALYEESYAIFSRYIEKAVVNADSVEKVIDKLDRALFSPRPRSRYTVGRQAQLGALISHLPGRFADELVARVRT